MLFGLIGNSKTKKPAMSRSPCVVMWFFRMVPVSGVQFICSRMNDDPE